jgi:hypothetical protein
MTGSSPDNTVIQLSLFGNLSVINLSNNRATFLPVRVKGGLMLSYLYRLATRFENAHGYRANLLYLNTSHYAQLKSELAAIKGLGEMVQFLGMEIVVEGGVTHPHVAYTILETQNAAAV